MSSFQLRYNIWPCYKFGINFYKIFSLCWIRLNEFRFIYLKKVRFYYINNIEFSFLLNSIFKVHMKKILLIGAIGLVANTAPINQYSP